MTDRRTVRATSELFDDLDRQLPAERGQNGDLPDYRILVKRGLLVPWLTVVAHLTPDGALELVALDIDAER